MSLPRRKAIRGAKKSCENGTAVAHAKGGAFFAPRDFDRRNYQWFVGLERCDSGSRHIPTRFAEWAWWRETGTPYHPLYERR